MYIASACSTSAPMTPPRTPPGRRRGHRRGWPKAKGDTLAGRPGRGPAGARRRAATAHTSRSNRVFIRPCAAVPEPFRAHVSPFPATDRIVADLSMARSSTQKGAAASAGSRARPSPNCWRATTQETGTVVSLTAVGQLVSGPSKQPYTLSVAPQPCTPGSLQLY
jgi:hypothetical protein